MFGFTRPWEMRHMLKKAEGNGSYINVGAIRLRETNPDKLSRNELEGK